MHTPDKNVKKLLATFLGIEVDDINDEDSLVEDLHMSPAEIAEFLEKLTASGIDISPIDLTSLQTFADLIDMLDLHQDIN